MHPSLIDLSSRLLYDVKIDSHPSTRGSKFDRVLAEFNADLYSGHNRGTNKPLGWNGSQRKAIDVSDGVAVSYRDSTTKKNDREWVLAHHLAHRLLNWRSRLADCQDFRFLPEDMVFLTPYSGQKNHCLVEQSTLHDARDNNEEGIFLNDNPHIAAYTVTSFEGAEARIVFLSLVVTPDEEKQTLDARFAGNQARLNVALTRARYGLYILGSFKKFHTRNDLASVSSKFFHALVHDCYKKDDVDSFKVVEYENPSAYYRPVTAQSAADPPASGPDYSTDLGKPSKGVEGTVNTPMNYAEGVKGSQTSTTESSKGAATNNAPAVPQSAAKRRFMDPRDPDWIDPTEAELDPSSKSTLLLLQSTFH